MTTIEVTHTMPALETKTSIQLPFYFTSGTYSKFYCCMTAEMVLVTIHNGNYGQYMETKKYDDMDSLASRLSNEMRDKLYAPIEEAVFQHKFSEVHRELFYSINPELKPKQ
jgi:hypothetical protein